jgi:hypothetical protein
MIIPFMLNASEFRSINPITRENPPKWQEAAAKIRQQHPEVEQFARDARSRVPDLARKGIQKIFDAWNSGRIEDYLSSSMYDRARFLDALDSRVPRDARIRIMAIDSVQPLDDSYQLQEGENFKLIMTTRVSARVKTQIEFNEADGTFRRIEGKNEFIMRLNQIIPLKEEGSR